MVSQFTSFLSVLQPLLKENSFPFVRLDGGMSYFDRSKHEYPSLPDFDFIFKVLGCQGVPVL